MFSYMDKQIDTKCYYLNLDCDNKIDNTKFM